MLHFNNLGFLMLLLCCLKVNTRIKLLLLIHINRVQKGIRCLCVGDRSGTQSRRRRQEEKEYRRETQKNCYKKLNILNLNCWIKTSERRDRNSSSKYPLLEQSLKKKKKIRKVYIWSQFNTGLSLLEPGLKDLSAALFTSEMTEVNNFTCYTPPSLATGSL